MSLLLILAPYHAAGALGRNQGNHGVLAGVLDLSMLPASREIPPIPMEGTWEFYWKKFPFPDDFKDPGIPLPTLLIKVPSYWNNYSVEGHHLEPDGFATFRCMVKLPPGFN